MICLHCGKEFEQRRHNIRYCTDKCRSDSSNKRNYSKNRSRELKAHRSRRLRLKTEVLTHYGPNGALQCCWEDCTVSDLDVLSLDHINNNGSEERRLLPGSSTSGYYRLKSQGFPDGYQTLCMNHQWKKELERARAAWED